MIEDKYLVLFSSGQDSTTCLYWLIDRLKVQKEQRKDYIKLLCFDYGQRHRIEIESAKKIADFAEVDLEIVNVKDVLQGASSLLGELNPVPEKDNLDDFETGVASTFVPARNMLFMTIAANRAFAASFNKIVTGVCETDYAGYYDCRQEYVDAMQNAINLALYGNKQANLEILTPLMKLTKAETVLMAKAFGDEVMEALAMSHTCYNGQFPPCGRCHSCHLRAKGFAEAGLEDPLILAAASNAS